MRWRSQRRAAGFNLAFLDIMACGLGAIILVFMLVKFHSADTDTETNALQNELTGIRDEIKTIESENDALSAQLESLKQNLRGQIEKSRQAGEDAGAAAAELIRLAKEISALEKKLAQQAQQPEPAKDTGSTQDKTHEQHLIGLRVTGSRILILLDSSASMADERLVDIIKIKASNTATKKAAPKWKRAVAVVRWILDRIPEGSDYMIVHYNAKADFLLGKKWLSGDDEDARSMVIGALGTLYPQGATNLHAALNLVQTSSIRPTDIYVITDGLPTKGLSGLSQIKRLKQCGVSSGKATVSGACREALFYAAIKAFSRNSAKVSTVLLPIEGDPEAAYAYWLWAASTTGMMISPAGSWP